MIQPTNMQNPYPQQGGANAVSINIYNPQAYGAGQPAVANSQQLQPYQYQNPLYQMPQASLYNAPTATMPEQFIPGNVIAPQVYMPQAPQVQQPISEIAPQAMPDSVIAPEPAQVQAEQQAQPEVQAQDQQVQPEVQVQEQQAQPTVDVDAIVQDLKSTDPNKRAETINLIASKAQEAPEVALQVVSEPVMQALVDIIKEDTTGLEGPSEQQIAVAQKIDKGEKLTPEEEAIAEKLSPRDAANKNRIFALYALAMIQKLQRDELNQYIETQKANGEQPIDPLKVEDLVGYDDVINVINNDVRPEVQVAAIQALQHVIEPQDKATVETVLADALKSKDPAIKGAAEEALAKVQQTAPQA